MENPALITVTVSKQTRKVPGFPSNRSIRPVTRGGATGRSPS